MHYDVPVELVDIAPTLLELAGLSADQGMHGKSLVRQLTDPDYQKVKMDLMIKSYDLTVRTTNVGTKITGRY